MSKRKQPNKKLPILELEVPDDLAGLTDEEIAYEERMVEERAERVQRRVTMNRAYLPHRVPRQPSTKGEDSPPAR